MKLQFKNNLYIAEDKDGSQFIYTEKPNIVNKRSWNDRHGYCLYVLNIFSQLDLGPDWTKSLHRILPDGSLQRYEEEKDIELKVNDPVYVTGDNGPYNWHVRHFSHFENGKIYCWCNGNTSYTATSTTGWDNWKPFLKEEWRYWKPYRK